MKYISGVNTFSKRKKIRRVLNAFFFLQEDFLSNGVSSFLFLPISKNISTKPSTSRLM